MLYLMLTLCFTLALLWRVSDLLPAAVALFVAAFITACMGRKTAAPASTAPNKAPAPQELQNAAAVYTVTTRLDPRTMGTIYRIMRADYVTEVNRRGLIEWYAYHDGATFKGPGASMAQRIVNESLQKKYLTIK